MKSLGCPLMRELTHKHTHTPKFQSDIYSFAISFCFIDLCNRMRREGLLSIHFGTWTVLFEKHLSVLNFIRQANKCANDYWMYTQTPWARRLLLVCVSLGSMRKPNCLANSNSIFNRNTLDALKALQSIERALHSTTYRTSDRSRKQT